MPKITIRVANAEKLETQFLPELASGGLFIRSDKFLPLGSEVDIDLYLPSATEPLPLRGRVTRVVDDDDARARKATGMTLAVDTNSEPTRSRLDALYAAYRIPVKKAAHDADVTPGHPVKSHGNGANGAMGMVVPLPGPGARPPPMDDDLPSPKGMAPPELPVPPSIPPAVPPVPKVEVMKFQKRTSSNEAIPLPGGPMSPPPETGSDKPLPFPFSRASAEPPAPPKIPAFGDLSAAELSPPPPPPPPEMDVVELPPPPPPAAAVATGSDDARIKQLEQSEEKAREEARWAVAEKEAAESKHAETLKAAQAKHAEALKALEAKHAETVKKLNDEFAKLQKQKPAEKKGSPIPAALIGLVIGAAAVAAYFVVLNPPAKPTTTTNTVATNTTGTNTVAANTNANANPNGSANNVVAANNGSANANGSNGSGTPNGTGDTAPKNNDNAMLTGVAGAKDAGTTEVAAVPEKVKDAGSAEVAAVPEKVKDAGTTNTVEAVAMTDKIKDAGTTLLASAEVHSDTGKVEEKKPVVEQKQPEKETGDELEALAPDEKTEKKPEKKGPVPLQANAGTLTLSADLPATVYVNGKKVGNAPIAAYKVNPGKVAVRFDCVVEDVRVKGKTKSVNLAPNGTAKVEYSCVE